MESPGTMLTDPADAVNDGPLKRAGLSVESLGNVSTGPVDTAGDGILKGPTFGYGTGDAAGADLGLEGLDDLEGLEDLEGPEEGTGGGGDLFAGLSFA